MAFAGKVVLQEISLKSIANAIREVGGTDTKYKPTEMADAIREFRSYPAEILDVKGDCSYQFAGNGGYFFEKYMIENPEVTNAHGMFYKSYALQTMWEDGNLTCAGTAENPVDVSYMFYDCMNLKKVSDLNITYPLDFKYMFYNCNKLEFTTDITVPYYKSGYVSMGENGNMQYMFTNCFSLGNVADWISRIYNAHGKGGFYEGAFVNCFNISALRDIPVNTEADITENQFENMVTNCFSLNKFTFEKNSDGTPKVAKWRNQVIDLSGIGYYSDKTVGQALGAHPLLDFYPYADTSPRVEMKNATEFVANHKKTASWSDISWYSKYTIDDIEDTVDSLPDTSLFNNYGVRNKLIVPNPKYNPTTGAVILQIPASIITKAQDKGWELEFA